MSWLLVTLQVFSMTWMLGICTMNFGPALQTTSSCASAFRASGYGEKLTTDFLEAVDQTNGKPLWKRKVIVPRAACAFLTLSIIKLFTIVGWFVEWWGCWIHISLWVSPRGMFFDDQHCHHQWLFLHCSEWSWRSFTKLKSQADWAMSLGLLSIFVAINHPLLIPYCNNLLDT